MRENLHTQRVSQEKQRIGLEPSFRKCEKGSVETKAPHVSYVVKPRLVLFSSVSEELFVFFRSLTSGESGVACSLHRQGCAVWIGWS